MGIPHQNSNLSGLSGQLKTNSAYNHDCFMPDNTKVATTYPFLVQFQHPNSERPLHLYAAH